MRQRARTARLDTLALVALVSVATIGSLETAGLEPATRIQSEVFEVASVRLNNGVPAARGRSMRWMPGGRFVATSAPLRDLIRHAYGLESYQKIEGDQAILNDRFDVVAKAADVVSSIDAEAQRQMLQALLRERFRLSVQWVSREESVYALVRARDDGHLGPLLRPSTLDCSARRSNAPPLANVTTPDRDEPLFCTIAWNEEKFRARGHRMSEIASYFSIVMQRPVLDRTELTGLFDLEMTASQDGTPSRSLLPPRPDGPPSNAPDLLTALRDQAGLRLHSRRDNVPALVIEHVEPPTEN